MKINIIHFFLLGCVADVYNCFIEYSTRIWKILKPFHRKISNTQMLTILHWWANVRAEYNMINIELVIMKDKKHQTKQFRPCCQLIYCTLTQATSRSLYSVTTKLNTACHLQSWGWFLQLPTAIGCSMIPWCGGSPTLFSFSMQRSNSEQQRHSQELTISWSEQREHFTPTNEDHYTHEANPKTRNALSTKGTCTTTCKL